MTYQVQKIISDDIPYYFLDLKGTQTFNYTVIQNQGSNIERVLHQHNKNKYKNRASKTPLFGISHLVEHLSFKGCKDYTTEQMSKQLKERGYHNAQTGYEDVKYYLKSISDYTDDAIKMVNNIAFNDMTRISKKELEIEKDIVISEANLVLENPQYLFHYNAGCLTFGLDEFDNIVGNPVTLKTLKLDDLIDTKKHVMNKKNLAFKIIYDSNCITPEKIIEKINKSLKDFDIPEGEALTNLLPPLKYNCEYTTENLKDYPQLLINNYFKIPDEYNIILSDWVVDYLNYYSTTGLFENVREKEGLCYSINIYSGQEFGHNTYKIHTEIPKDKYEVFKNSVDKSITDTIKGLDDNSYKGYFNSHKMNEKINLLNLNSLNSVLDKLIDNPDIFNKYEDLLKTEGIVRYSEQIQEDYMTKDNMTDILKCIKNSFDTNETILVTN